MKEKEIIEGNKLIAEFMGFKKDPIHGWIAQHEQDTWNYRDDYFLKYYVSWDWLMPVVEKIGKSYDVRITWTADAIEVTYIDRPDIHDKSIADFGGFGSLINTWKACVKFIMWFNAKEGIQAAKDQYKNNLQASCKHPAYITGTKEGSYCSVCGKPWL